MRPSPLPAVIAAAAALALAGCASEPQGPMISVPPTVSVTSFKSVSFSPALVKYQSAIRIHNNADADLDLQKISWGVDLFDTELFTDGTRGLKRTRAGGDLVVPFNFQVSTRDIANQGIDLFAEETLRVTVRGEVYAADRYGLDPVPFTQTVTVPLPRIPDVAYLGSDGDPLTDAWRLHFSVTNRSSFPISLDSVKTFVELNGKKYSLVHTRGAAPLTPGVATPVDLQMETSPGKALSMALNIITNRDLRFTLSGQVTCSTEYGAILIPLDLDEALYGE
jgi:hypothetical protein